MIGKKLDINKEFAGVVEVVGLFPRGQHGYQENHYQVLINGFRIVVPESVMDTLFCEPVIEPIKEAKIEEPVIEEVKEVKVKKVAKK